MSRPSLDLADIFRRHGGSYRDNHALTLEQLKPMRAIETCRNRHCPKCQTLVRERWLERRKAELLPTTYYHLVFTLPPAIAALALQNKKAELNFHGQLTHLNDKAELKRYLAKTRERDWLVYAKAPFGGHGKAIQHLGRYTHRVAISNHRLLSDTDGKVGFRYMDYSSVDPQKQRTMTLAAHPSLRALRQPQPRSQSQALPRTAESAPALAALPHLQARNDTAGDETLSGPLSSQRALTCQTRSNNPPRLLTSVRGHAGPRPHQARVSRAQSDARTLA